jgi:hypothetical protein
MPKDDASDAKEFYQDAYAAGFTTTFPGEGELASLIAKKFCGTEKDFSGYIAVLRALGMKDGDSLLDFGASWGYGSWQFRQAGFRVFSYEVSKPRAEFARTTLSCNTIDSIDRLPERVKCLFSCHVIEHLPNPDLIWEVANEVLTENGMIVCFCPNGHPAREALVGTREYHGIWGKVHPMLITPKYLQSASARYGFRASLYSNPYDVSEIASGGVQGEVVGPELCLISKKV